MRRFAISTFLRSKAGKGFLVLTLAAALLSAGIASLFYQSNARWFTTGQTGQAVQGLGNAIQDRMLIESVAIGGTTFLAVTLIGLCAFWFYFRHLRERDLAERQVMESEARFRDFVDTASDWHWETDAAHRYTYCSDQIRAAGVNPKRYLGLSRIDLLRQSALDTEHKVTAHHAMLDRHEPFREFVFTLRLDDGRVRFIAANGKPIFDAEGTFLGYRGTSRDVTDQIKAAEHLHEAKRVAESANRSKSEFLANMSHELRTPLNAIIGFADIIAKEMFGAIKVPQYKEYAHDIAASGGNLLAIINDILDMSKIEAGRLELREETVDVPQVAEACRRLITPRAAEAQVTVDCPILPGLPYIRADEIRIKQILLNLLSNAVKFTQPGGRVRVTAGLLPGGEFEIAVADTGIGMSAEQIEIALQPFRQLDNGLARQSQGTGLGLPLVKAFTELHGGRLRIRSVPREGTTVAVILPPGRVQAATDAPAPAAIPMV